MPEHLLSRMIQSASIQLFWMTLSSAGLWLQMHRTWRLTLRGMCRLPPPTDSEDGGVPRSCLCISAPRGSGPHQGGVSLCALLVAWSRIASRRWPVKASVLPGRCGGFQRNNAGVPRRRGTTQDSGRHQLYQSVSHRPQQSAKDWCAQLEIAPSLNTLPKIPDR